MSKIKTETVAPTKSKAGRTTKIDTVVGMLRRKSGASAQALSDATGWQLHSVRGAIAGHIKKKLGLVVVTTKTDGKTVYRIEA